ncbi:hypothetical protein ACWD8C_41195, partial [Streptomyces sp. NPDC005166]
TTKTPPTSTPPNPPTISPSRPPPWCAARRAEGWADRSRITGGKAAAMRQRRYPSDTTHAE